MLKKCHIFRIFTDRNYVKGYYFINYAFMYYPNILQYCVCILYELY